MAGKSKLGEVKTENDNEGWERSCSSVTRLRDWKLIGRGWGKKGETTERKIDRGWGKKRVKRERKLTGWRQW